MPDLFFVTARENGERNQRVTKGYVSFFSFPFFFFCSYLTLSVFLSTHESFLHSKTPYCWNPMMKRSIFRHCDVAPFQSFSTFRWHALSLLLFLATKGGSLYYIKAESTYRAIHLRSFKPAIMNDAHTGSTEIYRNFDLSKDLLLLLPILLPTG